METQWCRAIIGQPIVGGSQRWENILICNLLFGFIGHFDLLKDICTIYIYIYISFFLSFFLSLSFSFFFTFSLPLFIFHFSIVYLLIYYFFIHLYFSTYMQTYSTKHSQRAVTRYLPLTTNLHFSCITVTKISEVIISIQSKGSLHYRVWHPTLPTSQLFFLGSVLKKNGCNWLWCQ